MSLVTKIASPLLPSTLVLFLAACGSAPEVVSEEGPAPAEVVALDDITNEPPPQEAQEAAQEGRPYLLERVDQAAIVQLYADGFDRLTRNEKLLAYHLSQAAIAGRDIFLDQRFEYNLPLRWILESLWLVRDELALEVRAEVDRYCKLFWVHSGIHDSLTTRKMLLGLTWEQFEQACGTARTHGHALTVREFSPLRDLRHAFDVMTDPETFASICDKSTEDGKDPLVASCNNLYVGVTSEEVAGFKEKNGLNSRLVKQDEMLVEEVYRCGDGRAFAPGRYAEEIAAINEHLRCALPYAPLPTRAALRKLIRYNETGSLEDWREFNIAWVQDTDSTVDFICGFVEVYLDPRGMKGAWEAMVSYRDEDKTRAIAKIAEQASWFEARMPWEERFKKSEVRGISARAICVVTETGDCGPISPIGINLPNEVDVRENFGSKSVNLANVVDAYHRAGAASSLSEFAFSAEEVARGREYSAHMDDLHTNLHEVIGHGSGQLVPGNDSPARALGVFYSTLEEARADLVGLYWAADPKLQEMGLVPNDDAVLALYEGYARNGLVQLRRVPRGGRIEQDHMRNRQLIVHWLLANDGGVRAERQAGKTFYVVDSVERFRAKCGELLGEIMRIKAEGDAAAGKVLVEAHGVEVDAALHAEVLARIEQLDLPSVTGFVQPELRLETDGAGNPTGVEVIHCRDLADQMLRWSGRR